MLLCALLSLSWSTHVPAACLRSQSCSARARARSPVLELAPVGPPTDGKLFGERMVSFVDRWWSRRRERVVWRRRPDRIILIRHGESFGNTDKVQFSDTPDSQIELTDRGYAQAAVAGLKIRKLVGNETVRFFHSPYMRTRQTLLAVLRAFEGQAVEVSSEPRLREQDFGNFQDPEAMEAAFAEVMAAASGRRSRLLFDALLRLLRSLTLCSARCAQRARFGRFFYRFPNGEAGTDVFDRMATFITYLFRTMGAKGCASSEKIEQRPRITRASKGPLTRCCKLGSRRRQTSRVGQAGGAVSRRRCATTCS